MKYALVPLTAFAICAAMLALPPRFAVIILSTMQVLIVILSVILCASLYALYRADRRSPDVQSTPPIPPEEVEVVDLTAKGAKERLKAALSELEEVPRDTSNSPPILRPKLPTDNPHPVDTPDPDLVEHIRDWGSAGE